MQSNHPRQFVYILSLIITGLVYIFCSSQYGTKDLINLRLSQIYGFTSLALILITLYISPVYTIFKFLPYKDIVTNARRALGISAWFFSLLHSSVAFFTVLGGFEGWWFLADNFQFGVILGLVNLLVLSFLALTSFELAITKLGKIWYKSRNLVYICGVLILIHATIIGSHFQDFNNPIAILFYSLSYILVFLEAIRVDIYINTKLRIKQKWGIATIAIIILSLVGLFFSAQNPNLNNSLSIHSNHLKSLDNELLSNLNPLVRKNLGNPNINFHAIFDQPQEIKLNEPTNLKFRIKNDTLQNQVNDSLAITENRLKLVIVNSTLDQFDMLDTGFYDNGTFVFPATFSSNGLYHVLLEYKPINTSPQLFGFYISAGIDRYSQTIDLAESVDNDPEFNFKIDGKLDSNSLNRGNTNLILDFNQNISDVKASMIDTSEYQFYHLQVKQAGQNSLGITPFAIKSSINPGIYKLFIQYKIDQTKQQKILTISVNP